MAGLKPDAVVVVATVRALKNHGGVAKADLDDGEPGGAGGGPAQPAAARGEHHARCTACPAWWPSTRFPTDTEAELDAGGGQVPRAGRERGPVRGLGEGRRGRSGPGRRGGAPVRRASRAQPNVPRSPTSDDLPSRRRSRPSPSASTTPTAWCSSRPRQKEIAAAGRTWASATMPVCMAKTQYSFSDDATKLGAPARFHRHGAPGEGVRRRRLRGGAHAALS